MTFAEFNQKLVDHFNEFMVKPSFEENVYLFKVNLNKDKLYEIYLDAFPEQINHIYRTRRYYDCSCCHHFIKIMGNVILIKPDFSIETIWDFDAEDEIFQSVIDKLSDYVKSCAENNITSIFLSCDKKIGTYFNYDNENERHEHFCVELPDEMVARRRNGFHTDVEAYNSIVGNYNSTREVFKNSLEGISIEALDTVIELINDNNLYRGEEFLDALKSFYTLKKEYDNLEEKNKYYYIWLNTKRAGSLARIKNHSIGVLLVDITKNSYDLENHIKKYENIVAPSNYKRPKPVFTQRMLEEARKKVEDLGYMDSLQRRFAKIDDINVNNILFLDRNTKSNKTVSDNPFEEMKKDALITPKKFEFVEIVNIEDFIKDYLPKLTKIEALVENKHISNMVSLLSPVNPEAKSMFKWNNNFGWAYSGNITDSDIKVNVKNSGGNINGCLRFSIQWNDKEVWNKNDLDAHCIEPDGNEIYYRNKGNVHRSSGMLDIDIINPKNGIPAVENIIYTNKDRMRNGIYSFFVHVYSFGGGKDGFRAEIEADGEIYSYDYAGGDENINRRIPVADVIYKDGKFEVKNKLSANSSMSSKEVWNINTNQFVPVQTIMYSPNYWDEQDGIGNKHYLFMLKDCINPENPNGFYNEFLKEELLEHKRVFEALGSKMRVNDSNEQLSGIGFSSTKRNDLVVKITDNDNNERVIRLAF